MAESGDLRGHGIPPGWLPGRFPPHLIASVAYPEASESLIRRIARRLLVGFHNQYVNQLVRGV
jgi:hypothetical protein